MNRRSITAMALIVSLCAGMWSTAPQDAKAQTKKEIPASAERTLSVQSHTTTVEVTDGLDTQSVKRLQETEPDVLPVTDQPAPATSSAVSGSAGTQTPTVTPTPDAGSTAVPDVPTATPVTRTAVRIEVVDTLKKVPYGSTFNQENITLQVYYDDGTTETVKPDQPVTADTGVIGSQTIVVWYGGLSVTYTFAVVPRQVTAVRMEGGTETSMRIAWDKLTEAQAYEIYTAAESNGNYTFLASVAQNEYTFENMVPGQIIYVKVRAIYGDMTGEFSEVKPVAPKPSAVTNVRIDKCVKTKITLSWDAASGATGYAVFYRLATDTTYTLGGDTTALTHQVTGLKAGKDYYFVVYAYAADSTNRSDPSPEILAGTAPTIPKIKQLNGGDKRVKVYWKKSASAQSYRIYLSTKAKKGYALNTEVPVEDALLRGIDGLKQNTTYYVKVEAVRTVNGMELTSRSDAVSATTGKAKATSKAAKHYKNKKKFVKSKAFLNYKQFRKLMQYSQSFIVPGLKVTNVAGFNATRMVPQSIFFTDEYLLISAYDYDKKLESVIYVMDKETKKYVTTVVLPHKGHVGGMASDGTNLWLAYGKNVQCLKMSTIEASEVMEKKYTEIYRFTTACPLGQTASYVTFYKDRLWVGAYNEQTEKNVYVYQIDNKEETPTLTQTNQMMMPNRTQGIAFTKNGRMIVSRSCQTKAGRRGFMSQLEVYKPSLDFDQTVLKRKKKKKTVQLPPMNEGVAVDGSYTYVIYESSAFSECEAPVDRVTAFKTKKIIK